MVSTLPLMAASLLLGQTVDAPVSPTPTPPGKVYVYSNGKLVPYNDAQKSTIISQTPPENNRPILSKIHSWFGKRNTASNTTGTVTTFPTETAPPPAIAPSPSPANLNNGAVPLKPGVTTPSTAPVSDFPRKMPTSMQSPKSGSNLQSVSAGQTVSPTSLKGLPVPVRSPILPANANRIGRDEKFEWVTGQLEMEKGQYVLYYATPETVDPHHGRIQLNPQKVDMRVFHSGDLISVRGQLHNGHAGAVYQLTSADLIEKAKR